MSMRSQNSKRPIFQDATENTRRSKLSEISSKSGPEPETEAEKSVHFINGEVLDPPEQGKMSFMEPYREQVAGMFLEDARSFVQGAEQILLIALAKFLANMLGSPADAVSPGSPVSPGPQAGNINPEINALIQTVMQQAATNKGSAETVTTDKPGSAGKTQENKPGAATAEPYTSQDHQTNRTTTGTTQGQAASPTPIEQIQGVMLTLAEFHASIAETTLKLQGDK